MEKDTIKILVCAHKADENIRCDEVYMPIQVGKDLHNDLDLGFTNDNTGDNISYKNPYYCELTAMYWAWKNLHNLKYIGLCHYRRYFDVDLNKNNITQILDGKDIILSRPLVLPFNNLTNLETLIGKEDIHILFDELLTFYPDSRAALVDYALGSNKWILANMFVCRKELFDEYCNFIFPVLESVEKRIKLSPYSRQRRTLGYMGEFLLGFFATYRKLKVKHYYVVQYDGFIRKRNWKTHIYEKLMTLGFLLCRGRRKPKSIMPYLATVVGLKNDGIVLKSFK